MKKLLLLFFLVVVSASANCQKTKTITGKVTEKSTNEPLIGATVQIKNTSHATLTDIDGEFKLIFSDTLQNKILIVSYLGYRTLEIELSGKTTVLAALEEDYQQLDEVVVTGYGVQQKRMLTGSVSVVSQHLTGKKESKSKTWKRSGMPDNSIRLQVGEEDFLPLQALQMCVRVEGFRVRVVMDCYFYNDKGSGLEGIFKLKLPSEATPFRFAFGEAEYLDEEKNPGTKKAIPYTTYNLTEEGPEMKETDEDRSRMKEARIVSKQKAARAYEQTVSAAIDPALMEWGGADMFSCRVFPLSNNQLHKIVIGYDLNMVEAADLREYILTLPKTDADVKTDLIIYDSPVMQASISPHLSPTSQKGKYSYYSLHNPNKKEYTIRYNTIEPVLLYSEKEMDEELDVPYFAANYRISLPEKPQENLPEDAIFLLDLSLSSNPDKFNVWLTLINEILSKNRDVIKRFAILTFNIDQQWYKRHYERNNTYNQQVFMEYANTLALEGATDLYSALQEASRPEWIKEGKRSPKHIFLMSDADCNWGETNIHTFKSLLNPGDRIHTYKTGLSGTNVTILNYLSKISGGFAFTVTGEEEAELTARSFRYKPWTIENIVVEGVKDFLISGQPIQLYNGQKLIFTGREIPSGNIRIDVTDGTEKRSLVYKTPEKIKTNLTSRIYGQIAMADLENYGFQAEEAAVNYSTYYRVPGLYTSLLMLESEYDYEKYGIDDSDASDFVEENLVADIIEKLEKSNATATLGQGKADFIRRLQYLSDKSELRLNISDELDEYAKGLDESMFTVKIKPRQFRVWKSEQQSTEEQQLLGDDDIRFDNGYKLSKKRIKSYGKPDALKLLSSVIEKNAGDIQTCRDVARVAIEQDMGDHAYYLMRRIIDWREHEALAYLTAADALANAGYIDLALIYYYICLESDWDSDYGSIETISAFKCLLYLNELEKTGNYTITEKGKTFIGYMKQKVKDLLAKDDMENIDTADVVVVVNWNLDNTDIDLHVLEPTGEECYYSNPETEIGGKLTMDVTDGYGPEMYVLQHAQPGKYAVSLDYYSDSQTRSASKAKAYIDIYRNLGKPSQKVSRKVIELRSGNWSDYDEENDKRKSVVDFTVK